MLLQKIKLPNQALCLLILASLTLVLVSMSSPSLAAEKKGLHIVTSIKPLYLLAKELAGPEDQVELLVKGSTSPHHYQLTVSDRKHLEDADIVLWVGPDLETFLSKVVKQVDASVLTASDFADIHWPEESAPDPHGHNHDRDPHLWLDPVNMRIVANNVSAALLERAGKQQASAYQSRRDAALASLSELDKALKQSLPAIANKPFIVMHPAYAHFIERYGLKQQEYIVLTPERGIGARHLYNLKKSKASCVFGEVGQNDKLVKKVAGYADARVAILDPLGVDLKDGAGSSAVIKGLAETLITCLSAS